MSGAGLGLAGCFPRELPPLQRPPAGQCWIDVHCHVFNGSDLPVFPFLRDVKLSGDWGRLARLPVAILAHDVKTSGPTAEQESGAPVRSALVCAAVRAPRILPRSDAGQIDSAVRSMVRSAQGGGVVGEQARQLIAAELVAAGQPAPAKGEPPTPAQEAALLRLLLERRKRNALLVKLDWARDFTQSRQERIDNLRGLFDPGAHVLGTPALVDYDRWLGIGPGHLQDSQPLRQLELMQRLSAANAGGCMPVYFFLPFDPWRALEFWLDEGDPLYLVRKGRALGCIGVKVYPPMGFRPAGNRSEDLEEAHRQPLDDLAARLRAMLASRASGRRGRQAASVQPAADLSSGAAALDTVMGLLADYCAENDMPIMTHCAPSNFSRGRYAERGHPVHWRRLIEADLPRRARLRLNLGHFGGAWDLGEEAPPAGFTETPPGPQATEAEQKAWLHPEHWAESIGAMMRSFPNVYADVSYFTPAIEPVCQGKTHPAQTALMALLARHPVMYDRLMFGTDWCMVGMEVDAGQLPGHWLRIFDALGGGAGQSDRWRWGNAARFLGLQPGGGSRQLIDAVYRPEGVARDRLALYDPSALGLHLA